MHHFTTLSYRVPYADTDQMKVVYYANFYVYMERVRNEILRENDMLYLKLEEQGFMLPVAYSACKYIKPALYDDLLTIKGKIVKIKSCRIYFEYQIMRNDELLALGETTHACIDASTRKVIPIPTDIIQKFQ